LSRYPEQKKSQNKITQNRNTALIHRKHKREHELHTPAVKQPIFSLKLKQDYN
jgi:hypothetical protein